ncbi:FGFR4 isoform 10 [Pongo abelii]|uniref:FGFR4 isoform 10 n=1 Tax=Pongo abelii TaxID=9601 RepID=A0A2J8RDN0_PONAB|nr:FGFR4 isoform 10 [Pongo abelii]
MWLLLALLGVLLSVPGPPVLSLEASEEVELASTHLSLCLRERTGLAGRRALSWAAELVSPAWLPAWSSKSRS